MRVDHLRVHEPHGPVPVVRGVSGVVHGVVHGKICVRLRELVQIRLQEDVRGRLVREDQRHPRRVPDVFEHLSDDLQHRRDPGPAGDHPEMRHVLSHLRVARRGVDDGELAAVGVRHRADGPLERHLVPRFQRVQLSRHHALVVHLDAKVHEPEVVVGRDRRVRSRHDVAGDGVRERHADVLPHGKTEDVFLRRQRESKHARVRGDVRLRDEFQGHRGAGTGQREERPGRIRLHWARRHRVGGLFHRGELRLLRGARRTDEVVAQLRERLGLLVDVPARGAYVRRFTHRLRRALRVLRGLVDLPPRRVARVRGRRRLADRAEAFDANVFQHAREVRARDFLHLRVFLQMPAGADGAAEEDIHAVDHALLPGRVLHLASHQTDVRNLHGRARVRAPGPDHPQVAVWKVQRRLQVFRDGVRLLLRLDLREPAELSSRARDHPGDDLARERRVTLQ
mmetsp:Transcript_86712/g.210249  ORF Transcript_86712/g.210249 Transcript_86712/m.210249 type:complete len:453 (-) Transcript_86712:1677-3035(-)